MIVVDASLVVAALVDDSPMGLWAEGILGAGSLAAPHLMPADVANILRRAVLAKDVSEDAAAMAHADLVSLPVELFPYDPFADRVWELRHNLRAYDAWYVALAELLEAELATLDVRLSRAAGLRCRLRLPPRQTSGSLAPGKDR